MHCIRLVILIGERSFYVNNQQQTMKIFQIQQVLCIFSHIFVVGSIIVLQKELSLITQMTQASQNTKAQMASIVSTCNRKQISNLQIRTMLTSLAESVVFFMKSNQDTKIQYQKSLEEKIEDTKNILIRKIMGFNELEKKMEKICHIAEEAATNSMKKVESKLSPVLQKFQEEIKTKINKEEVEKEIKKLKKQEDERMKINKEEVEREIKKLKKQQDEKIVLQMKKIEEKVAQQLRQFKNFFQKEVGRINLKIDSMNKKNQQRSTELQQKIQGMQNNMKQFFENLYDEKIQNKAQQIKNKIDILHEERKVSFKAKMDQIQKQFSDQVQKISKKNAQIEERLNMIAQEALKDKKGNGFDDIIKNLQTLNTLKKVKQELQKDIVKVNPQQKLEKIEKVQKASKVEKPKKVQQAQKIIIKNQEPIPKKIEEPAQKKQILIPTASWIDRSSKMINKLIQMDGFITCSDSIYIFGKPIPKRQWSCTISIISMESWIWIGLADTKYKTQTEFKNDEPNLVFCSSGNRFWDGKTSKNQGKGFKQGQQLTLNVDLDRGKVEWKVGSQVRATTRSDALRCKQIEWVLWIYLQTSGEVISVKL